MQQLEALWMKGKKSFNPDGRPPRYGKAKTRVNLTLTDESISGLDVIAAGLGLSRSELVERIGRGLIPIYPDALTEEERALLGKDLKSLLASTVTS